MTAEEILKKCPTLGKITIDEMNSILIRVVKILTGIKPGLK